MDLLLKIVGGAVLVVGGIVGLAILFFAWRLRVALKGLGQTPTPSTISLAADEDPAWTKAKEVAAALAELEGLGYVRGPAYTIPEMPGVSLVALHHAASGAHGCYYMHPAAGHWVDLVADFADGTELTVGNPPHGSEMDTRPGTKKIMKAGEPLPALHARLLQELAGHALKAYRPEDFEASFTEAYAKDMAWRNAKGGTSEEEFLRVAENHGKKLTDEQLREAFKETKRQEIERWSGEVIAAFAKATTLSVAEWKRYEGHMFILRDNFHAHAFLDYLGSCNLLDLDEDEVTRYGQALDGGISLPGLLARIAADSGNTFAKLGSVTEPQPTDIYGFIPVDKPAPDEGPEPAQRSV